MNLADINNKYKGRAPQHKEMRFSSVGSMKDLVLAVNDVELDDGCFYDLAPSTNAKAVNANNRQFPAFPFDTAELTKAKKEFLADNKWAVCYVAAPEGAKRRLELSFWFTKVGKYKIREDEDRHTATTFMRYKDYRTELEGCMDEVDLEYMIEVAHNPESAEHYRELLKIKKMPPSKFMEYNRFFKLVCDQGEFKKKRLSDKKNREAVEKAMRSLVAIHDHLENQLEDILATASVREMRRYPSNGWSYIRFGVRLLDMDGNFGAPFQIVVLLDAQEKPIGYTFTEDHLIFKYYPAELEGSETEAQRLKRKELHKNRK